ncbi:MAG TPA: hypothetical protein VMJ93_10255 [Verrucomicrobiae bacterium]|nr:hypothetical protein [Verrucomicrobiae bacterium]
MLPDFTQLQILTERHLQLLHEAIAELAGSRPALTSMDLDGIYSHIARQTFLCQRLDEIRRERAAVSHTISQALPSSSGPPDLVSRIRAFDQSAAERLEDLHHGIAVAERELRHQNRVHALLIDGTRRTLAILANALATISPTYSFPPPSSTASAERVRP